MSPADTKKMQIFFLQNATPSQLQETIEELFNNRNTTDILRILDAIPESNLEKAQLDTLTEILEEKFLLQHFDFLSKYLFLLYDRLENEALTRYYLNLCFSELESSSLYLDLAKKYSSTPLSGIDANYNKSHFTKEYLYNGLHQKYSVHSAFPDEIGRNLTLLKTPYGEIVYDCGAKCGVSGAQTITKSEFLAFLTQNSSSTDNVKAVVISHAHLDHYGSLTSIINAGISLNRVFVGGLTKKLIAIASKDIPSLEPCMSPSQFFVAQNKIQIEPFKNGHILGSEGYIISFDNINIIYTGDFCIHDQHTVKGLSLDTINEYPPIIEDGVDCLIIESTYGQFTQQFMDHDHAEIVLQHFVRTLLTHNYKVFLPAFAIGRSQEIALILNSENRILLDGLSVQMSQEYESIIGSKIFNENTRYSVETDNKASNFYSNDIIISSSGMLAKNSTSSNYIEQFLNSGQKIAIILTGYMDSAEDAYGNILLNQWKSKNNIQLNVSLSAHASYGELISLINHINPRNVVAIHGAGISHKQNQSGYSEFSNSLSEAGATNSALSTTVQIPSETSLPLQEAPLSDNNPTSSNISPVSTLASSSGINNDSFGSLQISPDAKHAQSAVHYKKVVAPNTTESIKAPHRVVASNTSNLSNLESQSPQAFSENSLTICEPQLQVKMVNIQKTGLSLMQDRRDFNQSRPLKMACIQFTKLLKRYPIYSSIYSHLSNLNDYMVFWRYIDESVQANFSCAITSSEMFPSEKNKTKPDPINSPQSSEVSIIPLQNDELLAIANIPQKRKKKYPIHKVAKDFELSSRIIIKILLDFGIPVKNHMQPLNDYELSIIFEFLTQHSQEEGFLETYSKTPSVHSASLSTTPQTDASSKLTEASKNLIDIMIVKCQEGDYYVSEKFAGKEVFYKLLIGRSNTSIHFSTLEQARIVAEEMQKSKLLDNPHCQIIEYNIEDYRKSSLEMPTPSVQTLYDNNGLILFAIKEGKSKKFVFRDSEEQFKYIDTHKYTKHINEKLSSINNLEFDYQKSGAIRGYEAAESAHLPSIHYEIFKAEEMIKALSEDPNLFEYDIRFYTGYIRALQDAIEIQKDCVLEEKTWEIHLLDLRTKAISQIDSSYFYTYHVLDEIGGFIVIPHDTSEDFVSATQENTIYLVLHDASFDPLELRQELRLTEDIRYIIATNPLHEDKFINYIKLRIKHFFTLGSCDDSLGIDETWVDSLMQYSGIKDAESESSEEVRPAFGLSQISTRLAAEYASTITKLFSNYTDVEAQNISTLKGMCNRCIKHDQPDWKTTHQYLGYPDKRVLKSFVSDSVTLRNDLRHGLFDGIVAYREKYKTMLFSMLNNLNQSND